jgi:hypothetical protein
MKEFRPEHERMAVEPAGHGFGLQKGISKTQP